MAGPSSADGAEVCYNTGMSRRRAVTSVGGGGGTLLALAFAAGTAAASPREESGSASLEVRDGAYLAQEQQNGRNSDIVLVKTARAGGVVWSQTFDSGHDERAHALAKDSEENIFVLGSVSTYGRKETDFLIVSYNPYGGVRWVRTYTTGPEDAILLAAVDAKNNLYVAGTTYDGRRIALWTAKYDPAGNRLWDRVHEDAANLYPRNIYAAPSGDVVVTYEEAWDRGSGKVFTTKTLIYNPHGNRG